ncbi:hypothetical protein GCM10007425_18700 [Lysinibacillus alkalisoli]|uniref:Uncharacterized protein n=1 Tax=Lysinibacillus alkalisoli TaxID=1911548 RepID=A0A917G5L8_9BACI|nr:hypothetical protein [Lysinibacillus alkalisoli]GGG24429.1 hypothetical protein GCM10007425_18700 [Lysinibacillus alkalisoli]
MNNELILTMQTLIQQLQTSNKREAASFFYEKLVDYQHAQDITILIDVLSKFRAIAHFDDFNQQEQQLLTQVVQQVMTAQISAS